MTIEERIKASIRDVVDFPKPGVVFKDITPILKDAALCSDLVDEMIKSLDGVEFDVIAGVESRGFLFGLMLANKLKVPFVPIRKQGKLPSDTVSESYALEYGHATIEIHSDAFQAGSRVLLHDDLLATGGTIRAAANLVEKLEGVVAGYSFVINLSFLNGKNLLTAKSDRIVSLIEY